MNSKITRIISVFVLSISLAACSGNKDNDRLDPDVVHNNNTADGQISDDGPWMTFEKTEHDFGEILEGEIVSFTFKFKNTGNEDLIISSHTVTCGCTVPDYPKGAIAPGEEGQITIQFNSHGKKGVQNKSIVLATNCEPPNFSITIKAVVKEP
ncbi:MAG: hypothetical protein C0592_13745 [Marinilabiliales bacterium]|nr:MAG: hypothetical protein C0592_13745 [Marinilabiliales bacterium]